MSTSLRQQRSRNSPVWATQEASPRCSETRRTVLGCIGMVVSDKFESPLATARASTAAADMNGKAASPDARTFKLQTQQQTELQR